MCDIMFGELDGRIITMVDIFESAGLVDYLFDDNYADFSLVELYKMSRDTVKTEYDLYQSAQEVAASINLEQLMIDETKSKLFIQYYLFCIH